ncbi:MAG: hypothetical protein ABEI52_04485 [Halobacteriaceae archaeon]
MVTAPPIGGPGLSLLLRTEPEDSVVVWCRVAAAVPVAGRKIERGVGALFNAP